MSGFAAITTGFWNLYYMFRLLIICIKYIIIYFTGLIWGDQPYICGPLGFISVISCGLYTVSWQFDPCCQYQVETDTSKLPHVELLAVLGPSSPTFLVRKDDTRRRILHTTITLVALSISAWRIYQAFEWNIFSQERKNPNCKKQ